MVRDNFSIRSVLRLSLLPYTQRLSPALYCTIPNIVCFCSSIYFVILIFSLWPVHILVYSCQVLSFQHLRKRVNPCEKLSQPCTAPLPTSFASAVGSSIYFVILIFSLWPVHILVYSCQVLHTNQRKFSSFSISRKGQSL